jgi:hypothetical protein
MSEKVMLLKVEMDSDGFLKFAQGEGVAPNIYLTGYEGLTEDEQNELQSKLGDVVNLCIVGRFREVFSDIDEELEN